MSFEFLFWIHVGNDEFQTRFLCFHVDDKFSACFVCFFVSSFRIWFLQYLFYLASVWEESDVTSSLSVDLQLLSVVY